jgi:lactate dehydrogenase-like 2-hydroxyacid dehydrogenase
MSTTAMKPIVVVSRRLPEPVEAALRTDFDARLNEPDRPFDDADFADALAQADAILPCVGDRITRAALSAQPIRARIMANYGVGTNHIDLRAARERGLVVTNTPDVLTDCTADLTIALMLAVMRRLGEAERELRAGLWTGWRPMHMLGTSVAGKTLGIIGFGRIGRAVARRARFGFGMRVLFHTPHPPSTGDAAALGAEARDSIDDVLRECDVLSLHAPASAATRHLINRDRIEHMKSGAFLINTARGDLVETGALIDALRARRIAGAGLDVFENEPAVPPALLELPNVVLLPHIGSATLETRTAMGLRAVHNLRVFFSGRTPPDLVPG